MMILLILMKEVAMIGKMRFFIWAGTLLFILGVSFASAQEQKSDQGGMVPKLSKDEQVKLALSAAPEHIAKNAAVAAPDESGKMVQLKEGKNQFTCVPDLPGTPKADPICMDPNAKAWADSMIKNDPKPANKEPGIAYMARGGQHWEKDGKVIMKQEPGAKLVDEPPHWMILWAFDPKTEGMPTTPNPGGAYLMFEGTPYAHLMIYQDPKKLPPG
jgi:hypothetical protein